MEEKTIQLSGGRITYYRLGRGPVFLFLHGGIATPRAYLPLLELLAQHFTVFAPTLPGHGSSFSISAEWSVENFIGTIDEFCSAAGCTPDYLSGHSLGGAFALYLASMGRGKKVVVFNPLGIPVATTPRKYISFLWAEARAILRQRPGFQYLRQTVPSAGTLVHTLVRHTAEMPWFYTKAPTIDVTNRLESIRIPAFLLWGSQDNIVPFEAGIRMQKIIPSSTLVVLQGVGHTFPVTAPEKTYAKIKTLLSL